MAKFLRKFLKKKKPKNKYTVEVKVSSAAEDYEGLHFYEDVEESEYEDVENKQLQTSSESDESQISSYLLVAAIDLGTAASGYAFAFRNDFQTNPVKISTHIWTSATTALSTLKTPTCILFNPKLQFEAFGYDAQNKYSSLLTEEGDQAKDWYFFQNFKMLLYEAKDITFQTEIKAENSKSVAAITVFSESIKYLKTHLIERCCKMTVGLEDSDIIWTLTVPAIWNDKAKLFMRRAAELAGIPRKQLLLALEPEAGAIFCTQLPVEVKRQDDQNDIHTLEPGSCYMVVDAGGGTVDITIHEILCGGHIRELHAANGGPWGGYTVNKAYLNILKELFSTEVFEEFCQTCVDDYIEIQRDFEAKKLSTKIDGSNMVVRIPTSLLQIYTKTCGNELDLNSRISSLDKYNKFIEFKKGKMIIRENIFLDLFRETSEAIVNHIGKLIIANENISSILLVGGFSESPILQKKIRETFKTRNIIIPHEASLSVLKGAVLFGRNCGIVSSRVLRCTYGIECSNTFIEGLHDPSKKFLSKAGLPKCRDVFGIIAKMGESVTRDCASKERYLRIDEENTENVRIAMYVSTLTASPRYITEDGCRKIGYISTPLSGNKDDTGRKLYFSLKFGETEIKVLYRQGNDTLCTEQLLDLLGEESALAIIASV